MNEQQQFALTHPLNRADLGVEVMVPLTRDTILPGGNILRVILAVDR